MDAKGAIKAILKDTGESLASVSRRGGESRTAISERMHRKGMSFTGALKMLKPLNYKIVFMPYNTRTPSGGYEVDE